MESIIAEISGLILDRKISSGISGILKLGLLWLKQMVSQRHSKTTYLIISQNSEYVTSLS